MGHSNSKIQDVWEIASKVRGKDPSKYRKDSCGNIIYRGSYGKKTEMGWELDHKKSKKNGGSDNVTNLQALQWLNNRRKSKKNSNSNYC
jgi:5-methylcytosine-specific restriction endonuclease McrA